MKYLLITLIIGVSIISFSMAGIIHVPGVQPTIQAGINAAINTDTILVADGLYYENINFKGKAITVASRFLVDQDTSHISNTIINGAFPADPDSGSVVYFISGEDTNSVLCGFTITGGTGTISSFWNARIAEGIQLFSSGAKIVNNHIQYNNLDYIGPAYGGGIECDDGGNPAHYTILENNKIRHNSVISGQEPYGGGVELWSNGRIINNHVYDNSLFSQSIGRCHGGGIVCGSSDTLNRRLAWVEGNAIENNQAFSSNASWGGFGGGLYINRSNAFVLNNIIQNNEVSGGINCVAAGMAMWASGDTSIIRDNLISENKVVSGTCFGGGLQLHTVNSVIVEGNRIERNEGSNGGGIVCTNAKPFIQNNLIIKNTAINGGGILCRVATDDESSDFGKSKVRRSDDNSPVNNDRRVESRKSPEKLPQTCAPRIINNTIFGNTASNFGGGIYTRNSSPIIMNTILWRDSAQSGGHEILISSGGTIEVHYSDVQGSWPGEGNINADPLFVNSAIDDYHLTNSSPCLGTGIDAMQIGGHWYYVPPQDFDGDPRPMPAYTMPDIGADENPLGPSNILYVPQQYATIQAGIDAAENTDTVLVADGLYYENINFKGKAITVASTFLIDQDTSHISNTIINGAFPVDPDSGSVVYFISGEDTNSVLCGFTVTGGSGTFNQLWGERVGGGICITGAGGQVVKNKICNNSIDYNLIFGVGICVETTGNYYVIIEDNIIESNAGLVQSASYCNGGGIAAWVPDGGVRIKNNLIRNNTLTSRPYQSDLKGGGIQISCDSPFQSGDAIIEGNTIANNIISPVYLDPLTKGAGINIRNVKVRLFNNRIFNNSFDDHLGYGGGIYVKTSQSSIVNNIIYKNSALNGGGIFIEGLAESESTENKLREGREYSGQALSLNPRNKTEIYQEFYSENYQNLDQPIIINNTITQNFAQSQGGGMYSIHTTPLIMNTLFWRDSAAYFADEFYIYPGDTLNIGHSNFDSSEVYGYWRGPANLHEDPLLEDTVQFHLSGSSPCIDTGIDTLEIVPGIWLYCPCNDIEGNPRPSPPNSMPDMGAWELQFSTIGYPSSSEVLRSYKLYQNYPNPFNPTTTIAFDLRNSSNVKLIIYNILGEAVNTLLSASLFSGFYEYEWDASGLASGVYLYRLEAEGFVQTRKMILMK